MKKSARTLIPLAGCMFAIALTGCDMLQKNVKAEAQLPSDRETVVTKNTEAYRSQALERGEIGGYWAISQVAGKKAVGEEPPYLKFDIAGSKVYGNNGCNTLNSDYKANPADSTLRFTNTVTTMRACATEGLSEIDINLALANTAYYTWDRRGLLYTVTLLSDSHQPLMTLVHQDYEFLNGTWTVVSMGGKPIDNPDIKLVIDVEEQKLHGNTGCNILNGTLTTDMLEAGAVSFTNMSTTRMMCPDLEQETELLVALEEVTEARPVDARTVDLLDIHGTVILTLRRVSAS